MTPRQRFVEAQRKTWEALCEYHSLGYKITHEKWMHQVAEAWTNLECARRRAIMSNDYHGDEEHAKCVVSILKEIGL